MVVTLTHGVIANALIELYHPKFYEGRYYIYSVDNRIAVETSKGYVGYIELDKKEIRSFIHKKYNILKKFYGVDKDIKSGLVSEVLSYIEREELVSKSKVYRNLMYVANGTLDTKKLEVRENNPDEFVPVKIPVVYDEKASCPTIDEYFGNVTLDVKNGAKEGDSEDDQLTFEELTGFSLEPTYTIKKGALFLGERHSGKTTYMNLLIDFLGEEQFNNLSYMSLYDLKDQFYVPDLQFKLANVGDDIGYSKLAPNAMGLYNVLTGGIRAKTTRRMRSDTMKFKPRAKFYFSANMPPSIRLHNPVADAFVDRQIVIEFPNRFKSNDELPLKMQSELSGLLNIALDGLHRLRKNRAFSKSIMGQDFESLIDIFAQTEDVDPRGLDEIRDKTFINSDGPLF